MLTDFDIIKIAEESRAVEDQDFLPVQFARAVIAAYEAKLREPREYMFNVEVEGKTNAVFDTADEAVRYAMHHVYLGEVKFQTAVDTLNQGQMYSYSYGFNAAHIVPVAKRRMKDKNPAPIPEELEAAYKHGRHDAVVGLIGNEPLVPAPIPEGWISVDDALPEFGRTPILVAVSWVKYGEHDDGTPTEATGVDVTEGEYVPAHGEAGGYFDSYQGSHGDSQHITHWQPLPKPPMATARSE